MTQESTAENELLFSTEQGTIKAAFTFISRSQSFFWHSSRTKLKRGPLYSHLSVQVAWARNDSATFFLRLPLPCPLTSQFTLEAQWHST